MQKTRHIIISILCVIIVYTGSGFSEIHYKCAGCMDNSHSISRLFFPSKISTDNTTLSKCCCKNQQGNKTGHLCRTEKVSAMEKSCCGGKKTDCENSQSPKEKKCRTTKISKLDITFENTSLECPPLHYALLPDNYLYSPYQTNTDSDNGLLVFPQDDSPPPLTESYPIIYCTLLI